MQLNLPKKYLSYSSWYLWKKNKDQFRKRYYLNEPGYETRESIFGKNVAKMMDEQKYNPVLAKLPRGAVSEYRIEVNIGHTPILAFLDSFSPSTGSLYEVKTGRIAWNQERVNTHDQLPFYCAAIRAHLGFYDPYVLLCWLETKLRGRREELGGIEFENDDERDKIVEFTGKIEVYTRRVTENEISAIETDIQETAQEISEDYYKFTS